MAAVDYFLKLDGIEGESLDGKHKNEINLESWNWGESLPVDGHAKLALGKSTMSDFNFTMKINKASPKLFLHCAQGTTIKTGELTCRRAGKDQQEYLKIKFSDILVSSYNTGGSGAEPVPIESVSLSFREIEYSYAPQGKDGKLLSPVVQKYKLTEQAGS